MKIKLVKNQNYAYKIKSEQPRKASRDGNHNFFKNREEHCSGTVFSCNI